jgi:isopentenyl diphosphate isomerase/L-lactate dehydrogenase-like FMN-dependent dehydrogenase
MPSRRAARIANLADARRRARRALPRPLFDYVDGGADDELTVAENERGFQDLELVPRMGVDVGEPSLATTVLGTRLAMPIMLAPCGFVEVVHPDGAVGVAAAAAAAGTVAVLCRIALCEPEEVAARSPGPHWLQVNGAGGRDGVAALVERAVAAGFTGLVLTLDGPPPGNHERDLRNRVRPPVRMTPPWLARNGAQLLVRPRWTAGVAPLAIGRLRAGSAAAAVLRDGDLHRWSRFSWVDVEWLRERWPGQLLVKGVLRGEDARAAREAGADAVIVSNHGGRQLDGVPAPIGVLAEVVAAVDGSVEILLDGGVRRGTDVVKAIALGARAVMIGRPFVFGLAAAGRPGVERILELLEAETSRTLRLLGCPGVDALDPSLTRSRLPLPAPALSRD